MVVDITLANRLVDVTLTLMVIDLILTLMVVDVSLSNLDFSSAGLACHIQEPISISIQNIPDVLQAGSRTHPVWLSLSLQRDLWSQHELHINILKT